MVPTTHASTPFEPPNIDALANIIWDLARSRYDYNTIVKIFQLAYEATMDLAKAAAQYPPKPSPINPRAEVVPEVFREFISQIQRSKYILEYMERLPPSREQLSEVSKAFADLVKTVGDLLETFRIEVLRDRLGEVFSNIIRRHSGWRVGEPLADHVIKLAFNELADKVKELVQSLWGASTRI